MNEEILLEMHKEIMICKYFNIAHVTMSIIGLLGYTARKVIN